MRKHLFAGLFVLSAICGLGGTASATWVSLAKVTKVTLEPMVNMNGNLTILFDKAVTTCPNTKQVKVTGTAIPTARLDEVHKIATAALISGRSVEVNTLATCTGNDGVLDYISLK